MSLIVLGNENWSHQLEMSRKAERRFRSEREFWERVAARWSSRAMPVPPSLKADDGIELFHALHERVGQQHRHEMGRRLRRSRRSEDSNRVAARRKSREKKFEKHVPATRSGYQRRGRRGPVHSFHTRGLPRQTPR
jgi:hypothetical protein